jgi:hypothetical protein
MKPAEIGEKRIEALRDGIFAIVMTAAYSRRRVANLPASTPNAALFLLPPWFDPLYSNC